MRSVRRFPKTDSFIPTGQATDDPIEIGFDELEAMRLTDIEKLSQSDTAKMLNISRQSVQLMLETAREKLTSALLDGSAITITGGHYIVHTCPFHCAACGKDFGLKANELPSVCPHCGSTEIGCSSKAFCQTVCARQGIHHF